MKTVTVKVLGWAKYNPRKDIKNPTWFALSNRILEDQDLYDLTDAEFRAFIYVLSLASQKNTDLLSVNLERAANVAKVSRKSLLNAVDKLAPFGILDRVRDPDATVYAVDARPGHDTTIQDTTNKTEQDTSGHGAPAAEFDFDRAYKSYPRHEGKEAGIKSLRQQIRTPEDFEAFETAVVHYAELCTLRKTERKFIKLFSTFVGTKLSGHPWREFIARPAELDDTPLKPTGDAWLNAMMAGEAGV